MDVAWTSFLGKRPRNLRKNEEISILGFAKLKR
jgi:hypothetical protein